MKIHIKLLILITITLTLLSVSFASNCTSESDNLKMIDGEDNSIITADALKLDSNNNLNSHYLKENNEVQTEKKDIKKTDSPQSFNITSNNINQTFNVEDDEIFINTDIFSTGTDITFNIYDIPSNISYLTLMDESQEYDNVNIRLIGHDNLTLHNLKTYINGFNQVTIENIHFVYDSNYTDEKYVQINDLTNMLIMDNVTITVERNDTVDLTINQPPNDENNAVPLHINTKALIENCTINARLKESLIDWDGGYGIPQQLAVMITSHDVIFNNNNIAVIGNGVISKAYYSTYGVFCSGSNLTFTNNNITINNTTGYSYGLVVRSSNNLVSNNNITIQSKAYANAIYFARGTIHNNTIRDNYLNVSCISNKAPWGNYAVVYAVVLEDRNYVGGIYNPNRTTVKHNNIINNTIYASARQTYSIEVFGAIDLNISDNKMYNNGTAPMAIGIIGYNSSINNNNITCVGTTNRTDGTVDYIVSRTVGVYAYLSDGINITDNTFNMTRGRGIFLTKSDNILITRNIINTTNHDYTIDLNSTNITILYNNLTSRNHVGDESVNSSAGEDITVKYNQFTTTTLIIKSNDTATINHTIPITITVKDSQNNSLPYVKLIINNEEETTEVITSNEGNYVYNYTPTSDGKKTITVKLENYLIFNNQTNNTIITINESPTLIIDPLTLTAGQNTNITARITVGEETLTGLNKGKISFKVNGKTLKDSNGKVIYAKVVNGTATIENYEIPDDWGKNGITIQAVYSGSTELTKMSSQKQNITITPKELTITTEDKTATTNSTINLTATFNYNSVNTGKVVFKANGKTVKDANGKVVYAKVVNGTVSVEYILPENMNAGSYNITVIFTALGYDRLTDTKTLTVTS